MKPVLRYDFTLDADKTYPAGWAVEQNCEHPNLLGHVDKGVFALLFKGNKHIPITPPLTDFTLEFSCRGDAVFSPMEINIYFRYDRPTQAGYCLKYRWGVAGALSHIEQQEKKEYQTELYRYDGRKNGRKFDPVAETKIAGFVKDLAVFQIFRLDVAGNSCRFFHNDVLVGELADAGCAFKRPGAVAFDREHGRSKMELGYVRIESPELAGKRKTLLPEKAVEFPSSAHGILSPYFFHVGVEDWAGLRVLKTGLTGGPSKEPPRREIHRYCFHEELIDPYVRVERANGTELGKYYIFRGSVGLARYHWHCDCSVMNPADGECPLARDIIVEDLPADARFFIGYECYNGEDSITLAGGPAEALLDASGRVAYAGSPLAPGSMTLKAEPAPNRKIMELIPKDIPFHEDALRFAANNYFYFESETVRFRASVLCRATKGVAETISMAVTLENVFREQLKPAKKHALHAVHHSWLPPDVISLETGWLEIKGLSNGVYHLRLELYCGAMKVKELRRALEVLPEKAEAPCPPLASGLPQLYPNILSGIKNNHFYPWSHATVDVVHYNSGGDNFLYPWSPFKETMDWRAWELLHVYRRKWVCWGSDKNESLVAAADAMWTNRSRADLWALTVYRNEIVFNALLDFMRSKTFVPVEGGCLKLAELENLSADKRGITRAQFNELVVHHWKPWIKFFAEIVSGKLVPEKYRQLKAVNPSCEPFEFCPVYPTYGSVYKAGYFPLYFGKDLRSGIDRYLPGPNGFEDYPYSSGYAIARGIYQLASCKLECPGLRMLPEMFGINGETTDSHVFYANPPYGQSDPPKGFFTKQFFEYSFAASWFDEHGFSFWHDHGYYPKTWDRENYEEMLSAYAFISRVRPVKPLRTGAFVFSLAACMAHPDHFEADEDFLHGGYVMNTAEEAVAFAYEQARAGGLQAGFVVKMEDVVRLDPAAVGLLVLPPLCGVSAPELKSIRAFHEKGVNLVCFENCSGLEDLFGVKPVSENTQITAISVNAAGRKLFPELGTLMENTAHPLCRCCYGNRTATVILDGNGGAPVLTLNTTRHGLAAFYTIPPTVVKRARAMIATYGQESISELINRATALVMKKLSDNQVETTEGKTIAFEDDQGTAHIIVEEDAWPRKGREIMPLVTVKIKNVSASDIRCTKEYSLVSLHNDRFTVMMKLGEHETARIQVKAPRR